MYVISQNLLKKIFIDIFITNFVRFILKMPPKKKKNEVKADKIKAKEEEKNPKAKTKDTEPAKAVKGKSAKK